MKRTVFLLTLSALLTLPVCAQDDLYFSPKDAKAEEQKFEQAQQYYQGRLRDVDEFNRRGGFRSSYQPFTADSTAANTAHFVPGVGVLPDTSYVDTRMRFSDEGWDGDDEDYRYSRRMSRWDGFYDPWFYSYYSPWRWRYYGWYDPFYYSSFYDPWYYGGYWGAYSPWYYGYYSPWYYGGYYGYYDPWFYGPRWYGGYYTTNVGGRNSAGYAGSRTWSAPDRSSSAAGARSWSNYNGRSYGRSDANNDSYNRRSNFGSRVFDNSNSSRNYDNTRSNPSWSNSNNGWSNSSSGISTRSFGGGGGSFGGGGGSFGGGGGGVRFGGRR